DVAFPLNPLVVVTGVSASGKSTRAEDARYPAPTERTGRPADAPGAPTRTTGHAPTDAIVLVDQAPSGRTARSSPASYVGACEGIRKICAALPEAKARGYPAGAFSFNAGNGRCPACGGNGFEHVEMQFLRDVYLRCPHC